MRKPVLFIAAIAAFSIMVMSAISLAMSQGVEAPLTAPAPVPAEETAPAVSAPPADEYIVRSQDGVIVVCRPGKLQTPEQITDIAVASLREFDQKQLEKGISVDGSENLLLLLEDFGP